MLVDELLVSQRYRESFSLGDCADHSLRRHHATMIATPTHSMKKNLLKLLSSLSLCSIASCFHTHSRNPGLHRGFSLELSVSSQRTFSGQVQLNDDALIGLSKCESATQAKRILEKALLNDQDEDNLALYRSVRIPAGKLESWHLADYSCNHCGAMFALC